MQHNLHRGAGLYKLCIFFKIKWGICKAHVYAIGLYARQAFKTVTQDNLIKIIFYHYDTSNFDLWEKTVLERGLQ